MLCPRCQKELPSDASFCYGCGTPLKDDATRRLEYKPSGSNRSPQSIRTRSFESIDDARFIPGTVLAERYRIVGLLGKGGMGEVYRADDLKLSQPVALKFLPQRYLTDGAALARFHREVRVARQVSHRNVCRVYDIGEIDGHHFLSMEYIKGEELSSLMRRIGRLPLDKALQIARQLCAGLAAAHESGILHRDLKPSNVMIDDDGNARITDFGLAGLAEEFRDDEVVAGTPAYMSPEQLEGKAVNVRSDIYCLGLVLYELFTAKRAYDAATLGELVKLRRSDTTPTTPTSIVKDLDPVIERVIQRCIQKDSAQRPSSALQVAAALPGGDPIAAALAAGETPSPEMVAAAPKEGALKPIVAVSCLLGVVACLALIVAMSNQVRGHRLIPLNKPPEVLRERAQQIVKSAGNLTVPTDEASGFGFSEAFVRYVQENRQTDWTTIKTGQPLTIFFWHRQSPRYLVPISSPDVTETDPPLDVAGMTSVALDPQGRLVRFEKIPQQLDESDQQAASTTSTNWLPLFEAAGVDAGKLKQTKSKWIPLMYADERIAWEGPHVDHPEIQIRIEAAALHHKPVYFDVIFPWDKPLRQEEQSFTRGERLAGILLALVFFGVLVGAALMGRRNLKLGRSDKSGAFKLALFVFLLSEIGGLLAARHIPNLGQEVVLVFIVTAYSLFPAAVIWLLYIALEPYVRRNWPRLIISWSRLMAGNYRDPMVGRDLLIGSLFGVLHFMFIAFGMFIIRHLGYPALPLMMPGVNVVNGFRFDLARFLSWYLVESIFIGFAFLFVLVLLYILLRRQWLAIAALFVVAMTIEALAFASSGPRLYLVVTMMISVLITMLVSRFGLLATMAAQLSFFMTMDYPQTTDFSIWYVHSTLFGLFITLAVAGFGFYTSLGGQQIFTGKILREE